MAMSRVYFEKSLLSAAAVTEAMCRCHSIIGNKNGSSFAGMANVAGLACSDRFGDMG